MRGDAGPAWAGWMVAIACAGLALLALSSSGAALGLSHASPFVSPAPTPAAPAFGPMIPPEDVVPRHAAPPTEVPLDGNQGNAPDARDAADAAANGVGVGSGPGAVPRELAGPARGVADRLPGRVGDTIGTAVAGAEDLATAGARPDGSLGLDVKDAPRPHTASRDDDAPAPPLSPTETAIAVGSLSALGVLAGAVAYFWPALKYAVTPLVPIAPFYSRVHREQVLLHGTREQIYRLIREEPGIHAREVAERLRLGWGTAVHHLKLLERTGLISGHRDGRYKRFFVVGDERVQWKDAIALLRNDTARSIADTVAQRPGLIQKDVCASLELSSSLAGYHLDRLAQAGVVQAQRRGRTVEYRPGPAWLALTPAGAGA